MVHIMTINVNGLRNNLTRKTVFKNIRSKHIDICFIQESFITGNVKAKFENDWDGKIISVMGTQHSLGNLILIDKSFEIKKLQTIIHQEIIVCIQFEHDSEIYVCINVYYPNDRKEKCEFNIMIIC